MRHRQPHQGAHVSTEPEKAGISIGEQFPPSSGGGGGSLPDNTTSANEYLIFFV